MIFVSKTDELVQGRCNLEVDPECHARVMRQAERAGMDVSDYIGKGITLKLEEDEATDSALQEQRGCMSTGHCQVDNQQQSAGKVRKVKRQSAKKVDPPLKWYGGKSYIADWILEKMPPHLNYVEPYFGGGQVFFARDPRDQRLWWTEK